MIASVGKASPGMPDWWDRRSRIVISRVISGSFTRNHGRCSTTGSSQWTSPSSTRAPIAAAPNDLEMEPIWKRVCASTGSSWPSSLTPNPSAKITSSPCTTATTRPGNSQSAMDARMYSARPSRSSRAACLQAVPKPTASPASVIDRKTRRATRRPTHSPPIEHEVVVNGPRDVCGRQFAVRIGFDLRLIDAHDLHPVPCVAQAGR